MEQPCYPIFRGVVGRSEGWRGTKKVLLSLLSQYLSLFCIRWKHSTGTQSTKKGTWRDGHSSPSTRNSPAMSGK